MKAFVKTNNGTFPNLNFYMAWEAFNTMGYSVTCFEEKDIDNLDITVDTPVFAGVTVFRKVIDKLGINYPPFDCYPKVLTPFYGRNIKVSTLGEVRNEFSKTNIPTFVKPIKPKEFNGVVLESMLNLIPLANKTDDIPVYVCDPVNIVSEFRVYVLDGEILGVKHYYGDWSIVPYKNYLDILIQEYKPSPVAYGLDIAMVVTNEYGWMDKSNHKEIVLEVNDGCNLGNYGLDSIHYGEMIVSRWFEIVSQGGKEKTLKENLGKSMYNETKLHFDVDMSTCEWK
jgi:hypothetical protein